MSQQFPPQPPYGQQSSYVPPSMQPGYVQPIPPPRRPGIIQWMRRHPIWTAIIALVCISGFIGALTDTGNSPTTSTTATATTSTDATADTPAQATVQPTDTPTPQPSLAYQLASLDAGHDLAANDPSIARYQRLLVSLHAKTGDSEQGIADGTVKGQQLLHDKGQDVKLIDLLSGVNIAVTSKPEHIHYAEALAALITIMENQN
jgi:hypothetical protein